ncbi:phospholipase D-like domain-containing protein [Pyrobaculum neutrophilum]|uniref:Phospholipase D/transphosphatidylase n=1 Tax=Pyrobaculum neutrophilum (strain DSM 2338 / JCM 9278 / NBRC 100436 / V24Sta) TaxID=444157 RepID=B1YB74_PYRNV|nr:phospholipase D-like domain-containing protein [Pyrobaculum neutrophilum]ACB39205.1 phospholipase D/transphosphatidylase [Pyrobaculum neutrophilum V24Sta]
MRVLALALLLALLALAVSPIRLEVQSVLVSPINTTKIVDYVKAAKKSVYVEVYVLTYRELAEALASAAKRGVEVYVVLSARVYGGVPPQAKELAKYMEENGVKVAWNNDFPNVHTKLYVIDNETVIIGNINPTVSGFQRNKGVMLVIRNATLARQLATIVLNDYRRVYPKYNYAGVLVSPINSEEGLLWILQQKGDLYIAMEQIYMDSGLVQYIVQHPTYYAVVARTDADIRVAVDEDLVAKIIVVGDHVYVGSINIGHYSIQRNREVGLLIENPQLAQRLKALVLQWYSEAGGQTHAGATTTEATRTTVHRTTTTSHTATHQPTPSRGVPWDVIFWLVVIILAALFVLWMNRRRP